MKIHCLACFTISNGQILHAKKRNQNSILAKNLKKNGFARRNAKSLRAKNEMMKIFWIKNESLTTYDHA